LPRNKLKEMRQKSYISQQQKSLSSNKKKIIALRVISKVWILYHEAKIAAKKCTYSNNFKNLSESSNKLNFEENNNENREEPYHNLCQSMKDLKYIEDQFRKRVFKDVREYLKTIQYE